MSKSTRKKDNSKRQQPVQQQRAEATRRAISQARTGRNNEPRQEGSRDSKGG
jgi:hypothetical protein